MIAPAVVVALVAVYYGNIISSGGKDERVTPDTVGSFPALAPYAKRIIRDYVL